MREEYISTKSAPALVPSHAARSAVLALANWGRE